MIDIEITGIQDKDHKAIIEVMNMLSDYFSPETIEFADEQLGNLQGFVAKSNNTIIGFISFSLIDPMT